MARNSQGLVAPSSPPIPGEIRSCEGFHPSSCHFAILIIIYSLGSRVVSSLSHSNDQLSHPVHPASPALRCVSLYSVFKPSARRLFSAVNKGFPSATCIIVIAPPASSTSPLHHSLPSGQLYDLLNHSFISTATTSRLDSKYLDGWLLTAGRPSYHHRLSIYPSIS